MHASRCPISAGAAVLWQRLNAAVCRMLGEKLGGAIFVCSAGTVQSCLQMGLLGMMQDTFVPIVQHISVGMPVSHLTHLIASMVLHFDTMHAM